MSNNRDGFTMAEALILAIIAAVLAVTIVPQFSATAREAKTSALNFNFASSARNWRSTARIIRACIRRPRAMRTSSRS